MSKYWHKKSGTFSVPHIVTQYHKWQELKKISEAQKTVVHTLLKKIAVEVGCASSVVSKITRQTYSKMVQLWFQSQDNN